MKIHIKNLLAISFTISVFILITACGGGGGGSNSNGLQTPVTDLSGTWNVQETQNGNCEGSTYPQYETYTATVTQTGNDLNMTYTSDNETHTVSGIISGSTITWEETRTDGDSTTSIDFSGTVSDDGNTITGTATWTWTDDSYSCSGTTDITAARITQPSVDVTGTWNGTWQSSYTISGTFTVDITQQGSTLSGSIDVPEIGMSNADLTGMVSGNNMTFGDIDGQIIFTGTVSNGSTASGTYVYPSINDNGSWQGTKS